MQKFKTPNTGLKQYANLSAEDFFKETYRRNEVVIRGATGGKITEQQWVSRMMYEMQSLNKVTPKEQIRIESLSYKYYKGDRAAWDEILIKEKLNKFTNENNMTIYEAIRTKVRDEKGHFVNIGKVAQWLESDKMQVGRFIINFSTSPFMVTIEDTKTGKIEDFSTPVDDVTDRQNRKRAIRRKRRKELK